MQVGPVSNHVSLVMVISIKLANDFRVSVQTPTQIEPTKYVFSIENAAKIHHMVVFLLPNGILIRFKDFKCMDANNTILAMLDPTMAASVYFQLPGKEFQLLGA